MKTAMCDICGKAYTPGNLKKHMRMHGDNRPKKCTYCDRVFPTYKAMTGHRKFAHIDEYQRDRDENTLAKLLKTILILEYHSQISFLYYTVILIYTPTSNQNLDMNKRF